MGAGASIKAGSKGYPYFSHNLHERVQPQGKNKRSLRSGLASYQNVFRGRILLERTLLTSKSKVTKRGESARESYVEACFQALEAWTRLIPLDVNSAHDSSRKAIPAT